MRADSALSHSRFPYFLTLGRLSLSFWAGFDLWHCIQDQKYSPVPRGTSCLPIFSHLPVQLFWQLYCFVSSVTNKPTLLDFHGHWRNARSFYSLLEQTERARNLLDSAPAAGNPPSLKLCLVFVLCTSWNSSMTTVWLDGSSAMQLEHLPD